MRCSGRRSKSPDSVGDTAEERAINAKVAELFRHMKSFLDIRHGNTSTSFRASIRVPSPGRPIRTSGLNAWVSLGQILEADKWRAATT